MSIIMGLMMARNGFDHAWLDEGGRKEKQTKKERYIMAPWGFID